MAAGQGLRIAAEPLDVRDAAACTALVEKVVDRAGTIDLLVNNAGVIRDNPLTALEDEEFRVVLETNMFGTFNMTRAVAPHMVARAAARSSTSARSREKRAAAARRITRRAKAPSMPLPGQWRWNWRRVASR